MKHSNTQQFVKVILTVHGLNQIPKVEQGQAKIKLKKTKLNLFGKGITNIKILNPIQIDYLSFVKQIDLSHNALNNIEPLKYLGIQDLNLSHNKLNEQQILFKIFVKSKNCQLYKNIKKIQLKGNPFIKKPILLEIKRFLLAIQNDLELFNKQELDMFDLLTKKFFHKICLENLQNNIQLNIQFMKNYDIQVNDYQNLLFTTPQEYYKVIKKQQELKLQFQPLEEIKKELVERLSTQIFYNNIDKSSPYIRANATPLILQIKNQKQIFSQQIKTMNHQIQSQIFNVLTMKKMTCQRRSRSLPKFFKNQITPIKQLQKYYDMNYPIAKTPNSIISKQNQSKLKISKIIEQSRQNFSFQQNFITQPPNIQLKQHHSQDDSNMRNSIQRNPFQQIIKQSNREPNNLINRKNNYNEDTKLKTNFQPPVSPIKKNNTKSVQLNKRFHSKNTSKTLFELSQSLLKHPHLGTSQQSINFNFIVEDKQNEKVLQNLQFGAQYIQKYFFKILMKFNPIYHLLYSPLQSLKQTQKINLINNLLIGLKQKYKQVQCLQKYKVLHQDSLKKNKQLQKLLEIQKYNVINEINKNKQLNKKLQSNQNQINKLSNQLQLKTQQNFNIKNQIDKLKIEIDKLKNIKLTKQIEECLEQKIRLKRENKIKENYFEIIKKKANKVFKFNKNIAKLKQRENQTILIECFDALKQQVKITKKSSILNYQYKSKIFKQFLSTIKSCVTKKHQINTKNQQIIKIMKNIEGIKLISKLNYLFYYKHSIIKADNFHNHILKRFLFNKLIQNKQDQFDLHYESMIIQFRQDSKLRLKSMVFHQWLIWQKGLLHKEIQVRVNHQATLATLVIANLCKFFSYEKSLQAKQIALSLHLFNMRKINTFHKFYLYISLQLQRWRSKVYKVNALIKGIHLNQFMSSIRGAAFKRKFKERGETTQRKLVFNQLTSQKMKKLFGIAHTKKSIFRIYSISVKNQLNLFKKTIDFQKIKIDQKLIEFLNYLTNHHNSKKQLNSKKLQLKYFIRSRTNTQSSSIHKSIMKLFNNLKTKKRIKRNLIQFFINKNNMIMTKYFYLFKIKVLQQKCFYFQEKLQQLGPDIELIQQRQFQSHIQKTALLRDLQLKSHQILDYQRQIKQLQMLLQAKEIKYQKLKDIYAQAVELNSKQRQIYQQDYHNNYVSGFGDSYQSNISKINSKIQRQKIGKLNLPINYTKLTTNYSRFSPERDTKLDKPRLSEYLYKNHQEKRNQAQKATVKRQNKNLFDKNEQYQNFKRF